MKRICAASVLALISLAPLNAQESQTPKGLKNEQQLPSRYPYVVQDILKYCSPEKGFWVDLGAGKGQLSIPLIEATGNAVLMIDPNQESMMKGLATAREKGLQDKLFCIAGVAEELPLPSESVELLVSRGAIFFFDDPAKGLREIYRVLRPGGKAYIGGGAGGGYPEWATKKLIEKRKQQMTGDEAEKWTRFVDLRKPEQMRKWAEEADLPEYQLLGDGAVSAKDKRVGQGEWILFEKPAAKPTGSEE